MRHEALSHKLYSRARNAALTLTIYSHTLKVLVYGMLYVVGDRAHSGPRAARGARSSLGLNITISAARARWYLVDALKGPDLFAGFEQHNSRAFQTHRCFVEEPIDS